MSASRRMLAPLIVAASVGGCVSAPDPAEAVVEKPVVDGGTVYLQWKMRESSSQPPMAAVTLDPRIEATAIAPGLCVFSNLPKGKYKGQLTLLGRAAGKPDAPHAIDFEVKSSSVPTMLRASEDFDVPEPFGIKNVLTVQVKGAPGATAAPTTDALRTRAEWLLREYVNATIGPSNRHSLAEVEEARRLCREDEPYQLDATCPLLVVVQLDLPAADGTAPQLALKLFDLALKQDSLKPLGGCFNRPLLYADAVELDQARMNGDPKLSLELLEGWRSLMSELSKDESVQKYRQFLSEHSDHLFDAEVQRDLVAQLNLKWFPGAEKNARRPEEIFFAADRLKATARRHSDSSTEAATKSGANPSDPSQPPKAPEGSPIPGETKSPPANPANGSEGKADQGSAHPSTGGGAVPEK